MLQKYLWTSWFFREELVDLQLYYSRTLSQEVFKHMCFQYFKESKYYYGRTSANQYVKQKVYIWFTTILYCFVFFFCFLFSLLSNSFILTYTDFSVLNFKICHKTFDVARINVCFKTFHNCFIVGQWWKFTSHRV